MSSSNRSGSEFKPSQPQRGHFLAILVKNVEEHVEVKATHRLSRNPITNLKTAVYMDLSQFQ